MVQRERFTFRIPKRLLNVLKAEAEDAHVSVNAFITEILRQWVEQNGLLDE